MPSTPYLRAAAAALFLALLFPAYWLHLVHAADPQLTLKEVYAENVLRLDVSDAVYLGLGLLEIVVLRQFREILHDHLDYRALDPWLVLLIANAALFYGGLLLVDVALALTGRSGDLPASAGWIDASWALSLACTAVFGALTAIMAIVLLRDSRRLPRRLRLFAGVSLLLGLAQLSVVLASAAVVLMPLSMLLLAAHLLRTPQQIEVV